MIDFTKEELVHINFSVSRALKELHLICQNIDAEIPIIMKKEIKMLKSIKDKIEAQNE